MTLPPAPDRLFGLPRRMGRETVHSTIAELRIRFERQYERSVGELLPDLQAMRELLFNPVAREERLRQELVRLADRDPSGAPPDHVSELVLLPVAGGLWLVTPEGRVAIPTLERCLAESVGEWCYVDDVDIHAAEHVLLNVTRDWARYRLDRTIKLRAGTGARMLPVAIAIPLLLSVNGNVGALKAMRQPKGLRDQEVLDQALVPPVRRFAEEISGKSTEFNDRHLALYNGYALSEARRRLGDDLRLDRVDAGTAQHHPRKALYIAAGRESAVLAFLGRELRERGVDAKRAAVAFSALMDAYDKNARPTLSAFGIAHDDPSHTSAVRDRLIKAMD